jgi:hypothetical protein
VSQGKLADGKNLDKNRRLAYPPASKKKKNATTYDYLWMKHQKKK